MMKARTRNAVFFSLVLLLLGSGAADAETAPFRIAVIGDSVMWGEGLHDLQKVSTKVHYYLQNNLGGRAVRLQQLAHCGAVIVSWDLQQEAAAAAAGMNGELPRMLPSITYQAAHQVEDPAGIDLVLMNGGINDVGVRHIMNIFHSMEPVRSDIWTMGQRMATLLNDVVVPRFPKATIVVTNYFPVISDESNPTLALGMLSYTLGDQEDGWDSTFRPVLAARWRVFHDESTAALRAAVDRVNADNGTQRVRFVESGFGPANAVGASAPWLYGAEEIDPVDYWRKAICDAHLPELFCYRANAGHPNRYGAEAYAAAILKEISPLIPGWRATNTPNTLALRVVTNSMSGSSITITVYATDAVSAAPRSGTVSINGVSGPTGSRITYDRCLATEEFAKQPYGPCPGQVSVLDYEEAGFER